MINLTTTTISLPRELAERARRLSRQESRTMSELFREAFRTYESMRGQSVGLAPRQATASWGELRRSLKQISRAGKKIDLTAALIRDRRFH